MPLSRSTLKKTCLALIAGMLFFGLWPLNYLPPNRVSTPEDRAGIRFLGRGEAVSTGELSWPAQGQPITLEIQLRPLDTYHKSVPHILSLCDKSGQEILYLGQWKNHIVMRLLGHSRWSTRVEKEAGLPVSLHPDRPVFLTFVFSAGRADFFSDGSLAETFDGFDVTGAVARRPVRSLVLGNSSLGDNSWKGDILHFSVIDGALDPVSVRDRYHQRAIGKNSVTGDEIVHYRFAGPLTETLRNRAGPDWDLLIPKTRTPLRREYLALPQADQFGKSWFFS